MSRATVLLALVLSPWVVSQSSAQNRTQTVLRTPTIQLSSEEMVSGKQLTENLRRAQDRSNIAEARWREFETEFKQAHPDLRGSSPRFASDFAAAYVVFDFRSVAPIATAVELSAEERRNAQALYNELKASDESVKSAGKSWEDFQNMFLVKHVPGVEPKGPAAREDVKIIALPDGKQYYVPFPWGDGIALTPDFRVAVPRNP